VDEKSLTWQPQTPIWRRSKKHDASDLDSQFFSQMKMTVKDKGLLCRDCHKWRLWKDLETDYEVRNGSVTRLWICTCGTVLRQDLLTERRQDGMASEASQREEDHVPDTGI
jgi:RNase P subunit RPR2